MDSTSGTLPTSTSGALSPSSGLRPIRAQAQQKWEANTQADRPRFVLTYYGTTKAMEIDHTLSLLQQKVAAWDNRARVSLTGCLGLCWAEPILEVHLPGKPAVLYANV